MFVGDLKRPPKPVLKPRPTPKIVDIPGYRANNTGYMGREPCTDYNIKMMQYEQRKQEFNDKKIKALRDEIELDKYCMKFMVHSDFRSFQRDVKVKVNKGMEEYDKSIDERREKLLDLFWREEREHIHEVVMQAQKSGDERMDEMKRKVNELKARREAERQQLAHQKRIQQIINATDDFRPFIAQSRLIESKEGQLQQIKENESRRIGEREIERMWHEMTLKEIEAKKEREEQDRIALRNTMFKNIAAWEIQLQEKQIKEQEMEREKKEDLIKINQINEEIRKEKIKELDDKRRASDKIIKETRAQLLEKQQYLKRRNDEEMAVVRAYEQLANDELEKEKQKTEQTSADAKKELMQYMDYVKRLGEERKEEDKIMANMVEEARKDIEARKTEATCKLEHAKQMLKEATLKGLAEQIEQHKIVAEEQLKIKQNENELIRLNYEQNQRLQIEFKRQKMSDALKYRADLKKQIEYHEIKKEREQREIERELKAGLAEEEKYRKIFEDLKKGEIRVGTMHPFRQVLKAECYCPEGGM